MGNSAFQIPTFAAKASNIQNPDGSPIYSSNQYTFEKDDGTPAPVSALGVVPIGSIFAWQGGYYTLGDNTGFTSVLGNTVALANTYLNPFGIYVCDGAAVNDAASPIFNAAGRYLPNLTDNRFLMGSTTAGGIGGDNSHAHTHSVTSNVTVATQPTFNVPGHYHSMGSGADLNITSSGAHTHGIGSANSFSGNAGAFSYYGGAGSQITSASTSHTHGSSTFSGSIGLVTGGSNGNAAFAATRTADVALTNNAVTSGAASNTENRPLYLSTFYVMRVK